MKRVEVRLNLEAVAPLLDVIKGAADELKPVLAVRQQVPDAEGDFAEGWNRELLQGQTADVETLLALFGSEFFASGVIALDPMNAETILRACAAVRLRLRERHLQALDDDALESSEVALEDLAEDQRKALAAYVFLATLQELIIQHLDPTVLEG
ncbi:MAG TPA: hypothetical protein VEB66_14440 [Opitutaceae bacterium]|nr:hypothetical protein [Opitutaceae bacterium]